MIITGFAGGELDLAWPCAAFSARTGKSLWTFFTVPGPGNWATIPGREDNSAWQYGGATVWQTPAVDAKHGLIYFSTGNAAPDFNGSLRKGDNLFSVSIVAIEAKTGKYRWHFQQVHHDLWDYDSPSPVVLFDTIYNGQPREAIAEIGKTGWVYILDRVTGKPLIGIDELPVPQEPRQNTAATQPFPGDPVVPHSSTFRRRVFGWSTKGRYSRPYWDKPWSQSQARGAGPIGRRAPTTRGKATCSFAPTIRWADLWSGNVPNRSPGRSTWAACSASPTSR